MFGQWRAGLGSLRKHQAKDNVGFTSPSLPLSSHRTVGTTQPKPGLRIIGILAEVFSQTNRRLLRRTHSFSPFLMPHRALEISEIRIQICEVLDRRSLGRLARISSQWRGIALDVLWKYKLTGMQPLLAMTPPDAHQWNVEHVQRDGCTRTAVDVCLKLDSDNIRRVLERSHVVRDITFAYQDIVIDLTIFWRLSRFVARHGPLFPKLRSISIVMPRRHSDTFVPNLPSSLARSFVETMPLNLSVGRLLGAFPQVPNICVGYIPHHFSTHCNTLQVHGVPFTTLFDVIHVRSKWDLQDLRLFWPVNVTREDLRVLVLAVVDRCSSLAHLELRLGAVDYEQDELWPITPTLFQMLSGLRLLTCLDIEAPMRSQLSDADWEAAVRPWPFLERLRVVPRTPQTESFILFPSPFPLVPSPAPTCTIGAVLAVAASCPRLTSLALPGVDCRSLPSSARTHNVLQGQQSLLPLRSLSVFDSPLASPEAMARFLRLAFPRLETLSYEQWPTPRAVPTLVGNEIVLVQQARRGRDLDLWDQVDTMIRSQECH